MTDHEPFIAAIESNPDDATNRLVYADWLDDRHDPRGEYLRAEVRLAANPKAPDAAELRRRMRDLRGRIDPSWLARFDQPQVLRANPTRFPAGWWGVDLPGYRDVGSTYGAIDYGTLPPLRGPAFDGSFGWLGGGDSSPRLTPEQLDRQARYAAHLDRLERLLGEQGMTLPPGFIRWMTDGALQARLPSCTDCEVMWPWNVAVPADGDEGQFLSFYADSQGCLTWHLYLAPGGYHAVVCGGDLCNGWLWVDRKNPAAPIEAPARSGDLDDEEDEEDESARLVFVAPSFEAFLYRWWVENSLWYKLVDPAFDFHDPTPLTDVERAYLDFYRARPAVPPPGAT